MHMLPHSMRAFITRAGDILHYSSSALQPLLWLCFLVTLPCFGIAAYIEHWIRFFFAIVGLTPIIAILFNYDYFRKKDPDRLHSERFQLRREELRIIESKSGEVVLDPTMVQAEEPPALPERSKLKETG